VTRRRLGTHGTPRTPDFVRRFVEGGRVRVQWRDPRTGKLRTHSYRDAGDRAVRASERLGEELTVKLRKTADDGAPSRQTVRAIWDAFRAAEFPRFRPNTKRNYERQFTMFADVVGWRARAEHVRLTHCIDVRKHYREGRDRPLEHRTIREVIATAKMVWAWAEAHELIQKNRIHAYRYRVAKDERTESPDEFTNDEFLAIIAALDPDDGRQWRPWVTLMICAAQGARQHAVLHLQWADVDEDAGVITWQGAWDKNGTTWTQPLRQPTRQALAVARAWIAGEKGHRRWVYDTPWVLPAGHALSGHETYTAGSLWKALKAAEGRAGIAHRKGRGAHGLRRLLAGNVHELTGDALLALQAIGDRDPKMLARYLKRRDRRVRDAFDRLDAPPPAPEHPPARATDLQREDENP
jgi:integrase